MIWYTVKTELIIDYTVSTSADKQTESVLLG